MVQNLIAGMGFSLKPLLGVCAIIIIITIALITLGDTEYQYDKVVSVVNKGFFQTNFKLTPTPFVNGIQKTKQVLQKQRVPQKQIQKADLIAKIRKKIHEPSALQSFVVDEALNHRENGFYLDCGASNGLKLSNSLFFEVSRNWSGILIEANHQTFTRLMKLHRKAYAINACLSPTNVTEVMKFKPAGVLGGLARYMDVTHKRAVNRGPSREVDYIECYPLALIMQALGRKHIDYLSLDVEGSELNILQTIPWGHISIDILTVEYALWDKKINVTGSKDKLRRIRQYIASTGLYKELQVLSISPVKDKDDLDGQGLDVVFLRKQ